MLIKTGGGIPMVFNSVYDHLVASLFICQIFDTQYKDERVTLNLFALSPWESGHVVQSREHGLSAYPSQPRANLDEELYR